MSCIFCKIAAGELGTKFIYESDDIVAFRDLNPQAPQHILIIPREHIEKVSDLQEKHLNIAGKLLLAAQKIAQKENLAEDGFRLVINNGKNAGQEVMHIHMHLLGGRKMNWPPG
ncbi:MAG: histidine triad nucleotide-binding protein [Candidatus Marinimicrobia bacterium]|nr:histidine triad nucleotide-binding protein [Candidatus Neomarinimicrobiota bacterium]